VQQVRTRDSSWAHGLDIAGPLGIAFPDTHRLCHIAWLAHRSLRYAFALAGDHLHEVFCELTAPDGRVAAQRLAPKESGLQVTGPPGASALRVLRTYAA
jgi:hypothetical protein